jgi:ribosome-binding factor A
MKELSSRQLKASELIKRTLAEIFSHGKIFDLNLADVSITISQVKISPDLRIAKVYVSPLGGKVGVEVFMAALKKNAFMLRNMVNKKVMLKYSPELVFVYDETFDNVSTINNIIKAL